MKGYLKSAGGMYFVIDSNQIAPFVAEFENLRVKPRGLTLSPDVLAEIIWPPTFNSKSRLAALNARGLRVGIQMQQFVKDIRDLTPEQTRTAQPFAAAGSEWDRETRKLISEVTDPARPVRAHLHTWAANVKTHNQQFTGGLARSRVAQRARTAILSRVGSKRKYPKFNTLDEVLASSLARGAASDLGSIVLHSIYQVTVDHMPGAEQEARYAAVMANPHLGRFFRTVFCYLLSYTRMWAEPQKHLNFDPSAKSDDWTDIVLALYAEPGDVILTNDRKLRAALEVVEPSGSVVCRSVADLKSPL